ncbi:tyrosine-protein kinase Shark [Teleopsis dalmanni]|uniref:tyrosine-protein kinase Shark n=1 Tax=Teleopsis dalmanni TaxID=139649 RepID=UPI0018CC9379|nr:tyrosine-protein kinase Shark [Teleopsis dalmanni]
MNRDDQLFWFHGKISREEAETLLMEEGKVDGAFLVRESNTASGDFVLNVLYKGQVCHYQIRRHGEDAFFSIDDKVKILHGLDTLVEFYKQGSNGIVTRLTVRVKKDLPPNDSRSHGITNLLHRATRECNQRVVSELLKCGYRNVDAKNEDGQTAVHLAAIHCDEIILKLLLDAGVNVNCMDTSGNMPLHYACRTKSASFIRILINAHANVQGRNIKNGFVPMHEAAKYGNLAAIKELLSANAPLLPRTNFGEFPVDLAREMNHKEVLKFFDNYKLPPATTYKRQWYHGTLSRDEAVETLLSFATQSENFLSSNLSSETEEKPPVDIPSTATNRTTNGNLDTSGCFLVRFSERNATGSGYVLTLLWERQVKNFIISQSSNYLYIDDGPYLPSLDHLIEHFMRFSDGLPVSLKFPVRPKPKPPLPLFSTMPRASHKKPDSTAISPSNEQTIFPTEHLFKGSLNAQKINTSEKLPDSTKKKQKESSGSVFNTLRLRSPKKANIIDSMNSLRKNKSKLKSNEKEEKIASPIKNNEDQFNSLFKNLSFSTEFSDMQVGIGKMLPTDVGLPLASCDEFYNVPKNNSAISSIEIENKTDADVEYFTKSDVTIEQERIPEAIPDFKDGSNKFVLNANGYIPTVDIRVFFDNGPSEILEASAAELREFSLHPERLESIISTTSTETDIVRYFNRQSSNASTITQNSQKVAEAKLNYIIPKECLELDSIIGEGEFGSVYKGCLISRNLESNENLRCNVAIKTLRDEHCRTNKQEFLREASVMIRLKHHCIVQLIGISKGETLMMVQEIVPLGSMLNFILDNKEKIKPKYDLKVWASQIACGMQYLESNHFVHRDLAARNILLASRNQAKISDFGLSRALGSGNDCYQATQGGKWPIKWYAPESFNNGLFSHASDVWSFGITLWEMFSLGEPPYGEIRGVDAIKLIENGHRLSQPIYCPDQVYEVMKNCWNYKPKDRPSFRYLTNFFAKDPDYQNIMELIKSEHIS